MLDESCVLCSMRNTADVWLSSDCGSAVFFFKQKTAYELRSSDWSSDVCSSDLVGQRQELARVRYHLCRRAAPLCRIAERLCAAVDRKSVVQGKSVSVRVDLGGRRLIKKKNQNTLQAHATIVGTTKHHTDHSETKPIQNYGY